MMCDAMWRVASFQSTTLPFIQILPVPGKAIAELPTPNCQLPRDWEVCLRVLLIVTRTQSIAQCDGDTLVVGSWKFLLLRLITKRAAIRSGVERLAALPAETRLRCFARLEA